MKPALKAVAIAAATVFFHTTAHAQADARKSEALAKESGCLGCHAVDAKKVGPTYKSIAAKFKGAGADKVVAATKASAPHAAALKKVKEEDLKTLANWILSL